MEEKFIKVNCPHCSYALTFQETDENVVCPQCDSVFGAKELQRNVSMVNKIEPNLATTLLDSIESSDAALAYLENYFATFNWENFINETNITISDIKKMVEKRKVVNASDASTWVLEFKAYVVPLLRKIEGLNTLVDKMVENHKSEQRFVYYDTYKEIIANLIAERDNLFKILKADIEFAKKYGVKNDVLALMEEENKKLTKALSSLQEATPIEDIPAFNKVLKEEETRVVEKYREMDIDAPSVFKSALEDVESGRYNTASNKLSTILEYRNAQELVNKINRIAVFGDLYLIGNKTYYLKSTAVVQTFNPLENDNKKGKKQQVEVVEQDDVNHCYELYEIEDLNPSTTALVSDIVCVITVFGSKLYYFKRNVGIVYFDVQTKETVEVYKTLLKNLVLFKDGNNSMYINTFHTKVFIKRILEHRIEQKKGCIFKKKPLDEGPLKGNNYELVELDLIKNSTKTIIPELVDVFDYFDNKFFYTAFTDKDSKFSEFFMLDTTTYNKKKFLSSDCQILSVKEGKIVYAKWKYTFYNKDLHILDIETEEDNILETNFYDFIAVKEGKVFYTVGNNKFAPLFSINFDGTNRMEIMKEVENIIGSNGNFFFFVKGKYNKAIWKISLDGKERICLCTSFKKLIHITPTNTFYIDSSDSLCMVRNDGKMLKEIAQGVDKNQSICIAKDGIYFTRRELINIDKTTRKGIYNSSIYFIDFNGKDFKKIMFDVDKVYYDEKEDGFYFKRTETTDFEFVDVVDKKHNNTHYDTIDLIRFYRYDFVKHEYTLVLTTNYPTPNSVDLKKGCFRKKQIHMVGEIHELPVQIEYIREDVAEEGEVLQDQIDEVEAKKEEKALAKIVKKVKKPAVKGGKKNHKGVKIFMFIVLTLILVSVVVGIISNLS